MTQSTKRATRILVFSTMALKAPEALLPINRLYRVSMYRRYHVLDPIPQSCIVNDNKGKYKITCFACVVGGVTVGFALIHHKSMYTRPNSLTVKYLCAFQR